MSTNYNQTLTSHNTRLQSLIDVANDLPEAGSAGGGSEIETYEVTFKGDGWDLRSIQVIAPIINSEGNLEYAQGSVTNNYVLQVAKLVNVSILFVDNNYTLYEEGMPEVSFETSGTIIFGSLLVAGLINLDLNGAPSSFTITLNP